MFKYVRYTPMTDEFTTHTFNELNENCKIHRFDVPYVSVECSTDADFAALMASQNPIIEAIEITQAEFSDMVQHSIQVKRMYDIANEQYTKECAVITSKYTHDEISTWSVQVAEAEAVKAGTAISTPFLDALATDESITITAAADKILLLRDQNAVYTAGCLARKWSTLKALKAEVGL
ncbi:hypothetical protein PF327_10735 [Sulfurovum sp. XTW-4]|uniref:Uncharacterized protein n=1 Tax=Sulfurovum xiamenensis TaxID=3019066 RepID=A0ABT7QUB3_9BACT|nr:hypothetical protein [Sulfurovum xiamenensis]MDM5264670.1 hypothetical protein [Sulfurovum xiamenensis]